MQAVRCPECGLLVGPGDYGLLKITPASSHSAGKTEEGFAILAESARMETVCPGSEMLGRVEEV